MTNPLTTPARTLALLASKTGLYQSDNEFRSAVNAVLLMTKPREVFIFAEDIEIRDLVYAYTSLSSVPTGIHAPSGHVVKFREVQDE